MTDRPPYERMASVLLLVAVVAIGLSSAVAVVDQRGGTPGWWPAAILAGALLASGLALAAALGRISVRWAALCLWAVTQTAQLTLPLVSREEYLPGHRPWPESFVPVAVAASALVSSSWRRSALAGVTVLLTHAWLQCTDGWHLPASTIVSDAIYNFTLLGMTLAVVLALTSAQAQLRREAAEAASSYVRARTTEQVSMHNARWDALLHDRVLAALETIARSDDPAEARAAAADAAVQLEEGPVPREVDAARLRDGLLQAVLSTYPLADTRFPPGIDDHAAPVPDDVAQALVMAVSEALRNAARHAYPAGRPGPVVVELAHDRDGVRVRVRDAGRGFRREHVPATSFGVALSIENRMDAVRGRAAVRSAPGGGTVVELTWSPVIAR